jgi:hypothetical protein
VFTLHAIIPIKDFEKNIVWFEMWLPKVREDRLHVSFILDNPSNLEWENAQDFFKEKCNFSYSIDRVSVNSPGLARNHALGGVESKWTCFWDADDLPEVAALIPELEVSNAEIMVFNFKVEDLASLREHLGTPWNSRISRNLNIIAAFPGFWRMAFQSNSLEGVKFTKLLMGEDLDFLFQMNLPKRNIEFSGTLAYTYRRYAPLSLTKDTRALEEMPKLVNQLEIRMRDSNFQSSFNSSLYFLALISANKYGKKSFLYFTLKVIAMLISYRSTAFAGLARTFLIVPFRVRTR